MRGKGHDTQQFGVAALCVCSHSLCSLLWFAVKCGVVCDDGWCTCYWAGDCFLGCHLQHVLWGILCHLDRLAKKTNALERGRGVGRHRKWLREAKGTHLALWSTVWMLSTSVATSCSLWGLTFSLTATSLSSWRSFELLLSVGHYIIYFSKLLLCGLQYVAMFVVPLSFIGIAYLAFISVNVVEGCLYPMLWTSLCCIN